MDNQNQDPTTNESNDQPATPEAIGPSAVESESSEQTDPTSPSATETVDPQPIDSAPQETSPAPRAPRSKKLILIVAIVLVLIAGGVALAHFHKKSTATGSNTTNSSFSCNSNTPAVKANYTSSSGGFSAWFPVTPQESESAGVSLPDGSEPNGSQWVYAANNESLPGYTVEVANMPSGDNFTASQIMNSYLKSQSSGIKVICSGTVNVSGFIAGRYALYSPASAENDSPSAYVYGTVVVNGEGRVYQFDMTSANKNDPNATKFLNSLSLK